MKRNAEVTSVTAGSVFFIIMLILMITSTVGSSFAVWYYKRES